MTVLLTRPEAESREIAGMLAAEGIRSLVWPLTRIETVPGPLALPRGSDGLLLTSANGARAFAALCPERRLPVLAVGRRTAEIARECGFETVESADGDAAALARLAARSGLGRLFHPRGAETASDLGRALAPHGVRVAQRVVYRAVPTGPPPPAVADALAAGEISTLTFWSPRNARLFRDLWRTEARPPPARSVAVAISAAAARPLEELGLAELRIARRPDREAMLAEVRRAERPLRR